MGDVGSTFLGALFAGLVLHATSWYETLTFVLLATPILADSSLCVFRRIFARIPVFQAHRLHLFQRLNQAGWSQSQVSIPYIVDSAILAVTSLYFSFPVVFAVALVELSVGI